MNRNNDNNKSYYYCKDDKIDSLPNYGGSVECPFVCPFQICLFYFILNSVCGGWSVFRT